LGISGEEGLLLAKIRLYADNCCDLEQDYLQELGIDSIALKVNINGKSYRDRVDLSPSQFYELIKEAGVMPTTSQVNPAEFEEEFRKILEEGDNEIIYVAFSSGLSGTYQSACIARDMVDPQRITVIDSRSASLGYGLTLIRAARAIAQGLSKEEVIQEIMDNIQRMEHVFIVGDFEMLKRGGRVSAASAFIGSLLSIKVIAEIKEGKINPVEKVKGLKKAKKRLLEIMAERGDNLSEQLIGIAHSNDYEGALKIKDMIAEQFGCQLRVIEKAPQILTNMDPDLAEIVHSYMEKQGISVLTNSTLTGFQGRDRVNEVTVGSHTFPADIVILSMGVLPNSEIAAQAGIELGTGRAIRVNGRMETNQPGIYAAGDCATVWHLISEQEVYFPMGTTANKQGRVAGENAAGGNATFKGILGTGISRIIDMEVSRTGLSEQECKNLGIAHISRTIKSRTRVPYYPDAGLIWVKLTVEPDSRQLLGGQIVGFSGAGKRIDTIAAALASRCKIDDLYNLDLAYSPPFSPLWDPVLTAINRF
jgi:DegV family protein with EDD domain